MTAVQYQYQSPKEPSIILNLLEGEIIRTFGLMLLTFLSIMLLYQKNFTSTFVVLVELLL